MSVLAPQACWQQYNELTIETLVQSTLCVINTQNPASHVSMLRFVGMRLIFLLRLCDSIWLPGWYHTEPRASTGSSAGHKQVHDRDLSCSLAILRSPQHFLLSGASCDSSAGTLSCFSL